MALPAAGPHAVLFTGVINIKIRDGSGLGSTATARRQILAAGAGRGQEHGTRDVLMVVCDGLKGLSDAIAQVWPQAVTQTCIVHLCGTASAMPAGQTSICWSWEPGEGCQRPRWDHMSLLRGDLEHLSDGEAMTGNAALAATIVKGAASRPQGFGPCCSYPAVSAGSPRRSPGWKI